MRSKQYHVHGVSVLIESDGLELRVIGRIDKVQEICHKLNCFDDLLTAVEHVLVVSEHGGNMNDIDWKMLQFVFNKAKEVDTATQSDQSAES